MRQKKVLFQNLERYRNLLVFYIFPQFVVILLLRTERVQLFDLVKSSISKIICRSIMEIYNCSCFSQ